MEESGSFLPPAIQNLWPLHDLIRCRGSNNPYSPSVNYIMQTVTVFYPHHVGGPDNFVLRFYGVI